MVSLSISNLARLSNLGLCSAIIYQMTPFKRVLFEVHPSAMICAYTALFTEGIIGFKQMHKEIKNKSSNQSVVNLRKYYIQRHLILQLTATTIAIIGFIAITINKNRFQKPHYTSWHGIFGLIICLFSVIETLGGLLLYFRVKIPIKAYKFIIQIHRFSGKVLAAAGLAEITLGLQSTWAISNLGPNARIIGGVWSCLNALLLIADFNKQSNKND